MSEGINLSENQRKARRARSLALGLALGAFVILVYVVTWAKLGAGIMSRSM